MTHLSPRTLWAAAVLLLLAGCPPINSQNVTDTPAVLQTSPAASETSVAVTASVSATFNTEMDASTFSAGSFTLRTGNGVVTGTVAVSGTRATFTPSANLQQGTHYTATIAQGVESTAGIPLANPFSWTFDTVSPVVVTAPAVSTTFPAANATNLSVSTVVSATFDRAMNASSLNTTTFLLSSSAGSATGSVTINGNTVNFSPTAPLLPSTQYTATLTTGVQSAAGVGLASQVSWSFTTRSSTTPSAPTVTSTSPGNGESGVNVSTAVSATFSASLNGSTVTSSSFSLTAGAGAVPAAVSVAGATATLTPTSALAAGTTYTATLTTGVKDSGGSALAGIFNWSFTTAGTATTGTVSGNVSYDRVPAKDGVTEGGDRLDYGAIVSRPARRIVVQAISTSNTVLATTVTNDSGDYLLTGIANGTSVTVRALAEVKSAGNTTDGIAPDRCSGASWDIQVVDNTHGQALYALDHAGSTIAPASGVNLHAALTYGTGYTKRDAAPFAIVDTYVNELELVCEATPAIAFPLLKVNWSVDNAPTGGDITLGEIGTSFYRNEAGTSNLYLLGKEDIDTDEYDDHVLAHEFGHYLEDRLFRSDSIGGSHSAGDVLDPRVAFGEGYGNAISGMTFDDPIYVDTSGLSQGSGFELNVSTAPTGNDLGVYSEDSMQHLLWKLYDNRNGTANSGSFDRLYQVLKNSQAVTPAFTTGQSFAAAYNATFGGASEGLKNLWVSLGGSYNSLCGSTCGGGAAGTDTADPFDVDNDLGIAYAPTRIYPSGSTTQNAEFWRLYKTVSGTGFTAAAATPHDKTVGNSLGSNKFGVSRWYRYVGTGGGSKTVAVINPTGISCPSGGDSLDLYAYQGGNLIAAGTTTSSCDSVSIPNTLNAVYLFEVGGGFDTATDVSAFGLSIN